MDRLGIHNRQRRLALTIEGVKSSSCISEKNKSAILDFCDYWFAEGLTVERVEHYVHILKRIAEVFRKNLMRLQRTTWWSLPAG